MTTRAKSIVIIGAPRSGTNLLRDVLSSSEGVGTWPCDEINYIWRHGNVRYPNDEFPSSRATQSVINYIRKAFDQEARRQTLDTIVEKTCANSLRVDFVDAVLPDARYVFICRDGIDAAVSARDRWTARLDIPYVLKKARYVPAADLPYYASRYAVSRFHRLASSEDRLSSWGPRTKDLDQWLRQHDLLGVCALQWQRCVESAEDGLSRIPADRVVRVRYEDYVLDPIAETRRICRHLEIRTSERVLADAVPKVTRSSLGKGRAALSGQEVGRLNDLVGETLETHGYA